MSVPNQKIVQIARRTKRDKDNLYAMTNLEALQQVMTTLKGSGLKMWLYLNKNQDNYRFELSRQACEEWGIKKDSYYDGIRKLIDNGYLRPMRTGSNIYIFFENRLAENPTSGESEFYFSENTKPATGFQKPAYGNQNRMSENPKRNNTYNTKIINDNILSKNPENDDYWTELEKEEEREASKRTWASLGRDLGF